MASFFQPASYDPGSSIVIQTAATAGGFLVYTNSTLADAGLLTKWYQLVVLGIGAACLFIPVLRWSLGALWKYARRRKHRAPYSEQHDEQDVHNRTVLKRTYEKRGHLVPIKSFHLYIRGDVSKFLDSDHDLHIIDLETCRQQLPSARASMVSRKSLRSSSMGVPPRFPTKNIWALVDQTDWSLLSSNDATLHQTVDRLKIARTSYGFSGLVISTDIDTEYKVLEILHILVEAGVPCMVLDDASKPCHKIQANLLCGIIYRNACILANGLRRDFFQATRLRNSLARYGPEKKADPNFMVGFLDLWAVRPLPSVIRRSYKFAKFHGAFLHHESAGVLNQQSMERIENNSSSAFDWLKREEIILAQKSWAKAIKPVDLEGIWEIPDADFLTEPLSQVLPGVEASFTLLPILNTVVPGQEESKYHDSPDYIHQAPSRHDFWNLSSQGRKLCEFGCFDLREDLYEEQYTSLLNTQTHLLKLGMLTNLPAVDIENICTAVSRCAMPTSTTFTLLTDLTNALLSGEVKVFQGLDSGFSLPNSKGHFWAISKVDDDGNILIFVSLKAPDLITTVVHTYLAQHGISRRTRFDIEMALLGNPATLHPRIQSELRSASYSELLQLLEQITVFRAFDPILAMVREESERLLIDDASNRAWVNMHSHDFLAGKISIESVLKTRMDYFIKRGSKYLPDLGKLVEFYMELDEKILSALYASDEETLATLSLPLLAPDIEVPVFDDSLDLYALMFFCSLRRLAFEEVYMETTDRCPLFLQQHDQAAVFAELWVLGSQCEIYFGIRPRALGAIIYDEYRDYLHRFPPSTEAWNGRDVFTAYHNANNEEEEEHEQSEILIGSGVQKIPLAPLPFRVRFAKATFLTIFCVPAIIDVGLLTFLGRGLYLTAFMSLEERIMANYAVLSALLITAGVTGWSGSGGGFYLYQSAFHNMNHFMVHRLSGGLMITTLLAVCGFVAFGIEYSWYGGFIFAAYVIVLSTYLNLLGIMATMHRDSTPFKSGRLVLARCLLITLLSPLITTFVNGHDVLIYLLVLYTFLAAQIYSYSNLCYEWASWTAIVPTVTEKEIQKWFEAKSGDFEDETHDKSGLLPSPAKTQVKKNGIFIKIWRSLGQMFSFESSHLSEAEQFFARLAKGHPYATFLLEKESNGASLPPTYSSTYLVQLKLALNNQLQLNRGLKEHSPFLLFRNAKYDLSQNVGLFLVALLDRWVAVSMSANGFVVNVYYNDRARYGVAFGLLYFLICAVSLDIVLQRYWGKTGRRSSQKLGNIFDFEETEANETTVEKKRWLTAISELVWVMICAFGLMTLFLWLFVSDPNQLVLYFAYIVGYSGVIVFQFNRVFTTDISIHVRIVFASAFGGYVLGVILHEIPQTEEFRFNDVIALCSASLCAAIGTWLFTDFCDDPSREIHLSNEDMVNWKVYSQKLIGDIGNHCTMRAHQLANLKGVECGFDDNSVLSEGIKGTFAKALSRGNHPIHATLTRAQDMLEYTLRLWSQHKLKLLIVDKKAMTAAGGGSVFAASAKTDGMLTVYVGMPSMGAWKNMDYTAYEKLLSQLASEAMLHETCEAMMNLRHSDATLTELLLNGDSQISTRMAIQLSWADKVELQAIVAKTNAELVRHLSFGIDVDLEWDATPEAVRSAIVSRVGGRQYLITDSLRDWLSSEFDSIHLHDWYTQQCLSIGEVAQSKLSEHAHVMDSENDWEFHEKVWSTKYSYETGTLAMLKRIVQDVYLFFFLLIQFIAIISSAGTDCGRELWFVLRNSWLRAPVVWVTMKIWKVCWILKNFLIRFILLEKDAEYKKYREWTLRGSSRTLMAGSITVSDPRYEKTGFFTEATDGVELAIYEGTLSMLPHAKDHQIANYDNNMRLDRTKDVKQTAGQSTSMTYYRYKKNRQYPISRITTTGNREFTVFYDDQGRIIHGDCMKGLGTYKFVYTYQSLPEFTLRILRATYTSLDPRRPAIYTVYWCRPSEQAGADIQTWTPTSKVARLIRKTAHDVRETYFTYDHKRDPLITHVTLSVSGQQVRETEKISMKTISDDLVFLEIPITTSFVDEDLLLLHSESAILRASRTKSSFISRSLISRGLYHKKKFLSSRHPSIATLGARLWKGSAFSREISTATLRTRLWKQWTTDTEMTALTACILDEFMLRHEPTLFKYWAWRDVGRFAKAKAYLSENLQNILAEIEISDEISQKLPLAIRTADLFVMGLSKDSSFVTAEPEDPGSYVDEKDRVSVIITDTGCWPDAPGGVSNCRRDLIDGHTTIRNYALTESANEYGIPRFQVERNVQMIKNLSLWGLDGKNPNNGLFENLLQMQVESRIRSTRTQKDIIEIFVPLLKTIVRGCRTMSFSKKDLAEYTKTFLNFNKYFDENDYLTTWRSKVVVNAWREAWLCEYADPNISNPNDSFLIERPTASNFDEALELFISYFFIFSVRIPEHVPRVYQSTHHGISSLYGMLLKIRRGTTWGIWDHAIMWRESCLNISPAQCILPISVQTMLLGAMKMASHLAYTHVDIILPCTAIYNPTWEAEIGTDQGMRGSEKVFQRKIDPITNGISNMDFFKPVEKIRTVLPTTIMLSNVQFIKDVKTAVLAAGVIINDFGFTKYNMIVYGAQDRQPSYAIETQEMITALGIGDNVSLGGFGAPKEVLKDAWLFMNSSLSEGLPLAIGEAALSGIPIVATEVGATAQVLTDADDPNILYGEVVPPNDPVALARAQITLLAMLGQWSKYVDEDFPPPPVPAVFTADDVEWITQRMYDRTAERRALGLKLREVVLRKFSGERYLREHEQMYWIQRHMAEQRADKRLQYLAASHPRLGQPDNPRLVEVEDEHSIWREDRWQDFEMHKEKTSKGVKHELLGKEIV